MRTGHRGKEMRQQQTADKQQIPIATVEGTELHSHHADGVLPLRLLFPGQRRGPRPTGRGLPPPEGSHSLGRTVVMQRRTQGPVRPDLATLFRMSRRLSLFRKYFSSCRPTLWSGQHDVSPRACGQNELNTLLKGAGCKLVVVEFSAKWCGPCKRICPLVHAMALQYQNVLFANVDVDESQELAQTYQIRVVPTFQLFKQAQKIFEFCGADTKKLEEKIQELMMFRLGHSRRMGAVLTRF